ncbi:hypothetical protein NQ315_006586 [Exocentrus adspersus]|uniref:Uncharacterized protein n=1 Tax=Exocentrus adspersus TaxID=1586481 RepID=A0AAV8VGJ1_9CUCU|nr:hypothetical protein NQ315_006586 [Exocentrus adspersus]
MNGIDKSEVSALLAKYGVPSNVMNLTPPKLNQEIDSILDKRSLSRDNSYLELQNHLGKGIGALGASMQIPQEVRAEILTPLCDSGNIFANLFSRISVVRRNLVIPLLNKNLKTEIEKSKPSDHLFGSDLAEKVKLAKTLENTSRDLKTSKPAAAPPTTSAVVWQRPPQWKTQRKAPVQGPLNFHRPARRGDATWPVNGQLMRTSQRDVNSNRVSQSYKERRRRI